MEEIGISKARVELSRLIDSALAGETIIVTRFSKPQVKLVPCQQGSPRRKFGALKGWFEITDEFFEPLPDGIVEAFHEGPILPEEQ